MQRRVMQVSRTTLVVASLACSMLVATGSGMAATPPPGQAAAPAPVPAEVTLVTGDRVLVGAPVAGRPTLTVEPAPRPVGRIPSFSARYDGDDVYVVPSDVAGLVPSVLDDALFDVTALVRMGYDDRSRPSIPLIVQNAPGLKTLSGSPTGLQARAALPSIRGEAAVLPKAQSAAFGKALTKLGTQRVTPAAAGAALGGVSRVWLDAPLRATDLDANLTQISAPAAWQSGLSGAGVKVAVLDTGVDAGHPDLAGQVVDAANFTDDPVDTDDNGHGTHVASLVAGTGAAADGARRGVAFGAHLLAGKVLNADGEGQISWVIAGMQWAASQGADVVNMSLGGQASSPSLDDPVVQALESLTASSGALFVVAAGNAGSGASTVASPGVAPSALTVGAVNATDGVVFFSSRGPTLGDGRLKPDITSPGVQIIGAKAGARTGELYTTFSGTSQATPQVAGAAALLMQQHPDWSWDRVKAMLVDTADPSARSSVYDQGGGRLDLARATTEPLSSSAAEVDFGLLRWPDRAVRSQQVTLTNPGATAATVDLAPHVAPIVSGPSTGVAAAAAADPVIVSTTQLTVPAGGSASFTVTLDPGAATPGVHYGGAVDVTTGGEAALHLPVGFEVEPERYDVTVTVTDRHGDPYAGGRVDLVNGDLVNGGSYFGLTLNDAGQGTARVAPGWYGVQSRIETPAPDGTVESVTFGGDPEVHVSADTSVRIDARDSKPLQAPTVPHVATAVDQAQVYYSRFDDMRGGYTDFDLPSADDIAAGKVLVQPTKPVQHGKFAFTTRWRLLPTGRAHSADLYDLVHETPTVPDPPAYRLTDADVRGLARLDVTYHPLGSTTTVPEARASWTDITGIAIAAYRPVTLPSHRVELLTAAPDVHWQQIVYLPGDSAIRLFEPDVSYQPRQSVDVHWLRALHPDVVEAPRYDEQTLLVSTGLGDGQHVGRYEGIGVDAATLQLRTDGAVVGDRDGTFGYFEVPPGPGTFVADQRLELDTAQILAPASSHTTWTFHSMASPDPGIEPTPIPPVVRLDYQPALDSLGYAPAGRALRVGMGVTHLPGSTAPAGPVGGVRLWVSSDRGAHWLGLHVERVSGDQFAVVVPAGELRAGGSVSVRAAAEDSAGNAIDQTVLGMFAVR
jgi:subtilisin family serine protease